MNSNVKNLKINSAHNDSAYVLLHPDDNILVCCRPLEVGTIFQIAGLECTVGEAVTVGHKIARTNLSVGVKVIRYGAPIGSITEAVRAGFHIHTHNMKSDYIPSHGRNAVHIKGKN